MKINVGTPNNERSNKLQNVSGTAKVNQHSFNSTDIALSKLL